MEWRLWLAFLLILTVEETLLLPFGSDWSDDHQRMLEQLFQSETQEEKWLISSLPDSTVKKFPKLEVQDLAEVHPDIFWRLPDKVVLESSGFSGSVLADQIRLRSSHDLSVVRKVSTALRLATDSEKLEFLENLDEKMTNIEWKTLGKKNLY
jgi:hypothetical protein